MKKSINWLWHTGPSGWASIDCQGGVFGVSVKSPRKTGEKPRVVKYAALPGEATSVDALSQVNRLIGSSGFPWVGVLDRSEYQMFLVEKAAVQAEEMEHSLRWTLSPLIDYPATEANFSWMEIPTLNAPTGRTPQLYVVTSRRELVEKRTDLFEAAHIELAALDIRETGQRNISVAMEKPNEGVCLVFAEPKGIQLTVTFNGELYLERFIREALFDEVDINVPDQASLEFDRVALEIQRSIDFIRRNFPSLLISRVWVGPTEKEIGLAKELGDRLLEPVQSLDLGQVFDWPQGSELVRPEVQALYFNALGAALRFKE